MLELLFSIIYRKIVYKIKEKWKTNLESIIKDHRRLKLRIYIPNEDNPKKETANLPETKKITQLK